MKRLATSSIVLASLVLPAAAVLADSYITGDYRDGASVGTKDGGSEFRLILNKGERISKLEIYSHHGKYHVVCAMRMFAKDKEGREREVGVAGHIANGEADPQTFELAEDEYLTEIDVQKGRWVDCLKFVTNKKQYDVWYGGKHWDDDRHGAAETPDSHHLKAGDGRKIVGFRIYSTDRDFNLLEIFTGAEN